MNEMPLVSIALCTYNGEKFLKQQLDTLVNQTYKNLEIVAVDDCSVDGTLNMLNIYAKKHPNFFVYKNEHNIGFLKNFELASNYCKGEFIAFCDQDDLWQLNKIELMVAAIGNNQFLYHDSEFIDDENNLLGGKMSDIFNFYRGDQPEVFLFNNCVSGHAMLVRKDLLPHAFPLKENYYHDWWLAYVATNIGTIDFLPQCLVQYRQHNDSNTDLLSLNIKKKNKRNNLPKTVKLKMEAKWLEHCLNYPENKDAKLVKRLVALYEARYNSFLSVRYWKLLRENMQVLFFINKNNDSWKYREIRKNIWGMKGKNFWYTYIKPDPDKIVKFTK